MTSKLFKPYDSIPAAFLAVLACVFLMVSCAAPTGKAVSTLTLPPPTSLPSSSIPPTPSASALLNLPAGFALAGEWSGMARDGDFGMSVTLVLSSSCTIGQVCGNIDLAEIPCSASFTLLSDSGGIYEFQAGDKIGNCGAGRDFLKPLPDGSLLYTSRGEYGETNGVLVNKAAFRKAVIIDDDGSPDGTTALLYLLSRRDVEIKAVGISYGEAHPSVYIQHMGRMMEDFGYTGIPLGAGLDGSLSGNEGFPEWLRDAADNFWSWPLPNATKTYPVEDSAELLVRLLSKSPRSVDLFFSGPVTNLARALRLAPAIRDHIGTLYMMAGAVFVAGNVHDFYPDSANVYADWNPYSDPLAYQEVFESGIKMVLIPLDATNQVKVDRQDTLTWRSGGRIANFVANVYDGLMNEKGQTFIWDLLAATVMTEPDLCGYQDLHLDVVTQAGDHFGQLVVNPQAEPNIRVCLVPAEAGINQTLTDIFSQSR